MPNGITVSSVTSAVKSVPLVGKFMSNIFKKPQTTDGYGKFCNPDPAKGGYYPGEENIPMVGAFLNNQPMTAKMKADVTAWVMARAINWTKAQKASLLSHCQNIVVIPDPAPIAPPEVHTLSASYNPPVIEKSRDIQEVVQAGITKFPTWLFGVIGVVLFLPALLKGGKK